MRTRFPALALGLAVLTGSLVSTIATAGPARAAWAMTGIDVSKYQQPAYAAAPIDWSAAAAAGVDFAIVKATEGRTKIDPEFTTNATGAQAAGVRIGMYHVATPSTSTADAHTEADHFLAVAMPAAGNVIPALDIEINRVPAGMTPTELETWARAWLTRVTNRLGVRPMVYGSVYMFQTLLGNTTWFADHGYPLWLARWGPLPAMLPANDWQGQGWTFWQWSSTGSIAGISTAVDRDRFVGSDLVTASIASLTVQPGTGGSIADDTGRLVCAATSTCTTLYSPGDAVQLTASPAPGYSLVSWGGACASAGAPPTCSLTALGAQTVTATFSYRLTVRVRGSIPGRVRSNPAPIDCPGTCAAPFASGTTVALTASTDRWAGVTWSGDCTGTDPAGCSVTMDQPRTVTATFADLGQTLAANFGLGPLAYGMSFLEEIVAHDS